MYRIPHLLIKYTTISHLEVHRTIIVLHVTDLDDMISILDAHHINIIEVHPGKTSHKFGVFTIARPNKGSKDGEVFIPMSSYDSVFKNLVLE